MLHSVPSCSLPSAAQLTGIRRGIEKEGLRVLPDGTLALTPHPLALGSALTHPHITTDYSESQLELITGVHGSIDDCLRELTQVHQYVSRSMAVESPPQMVWNLSMPCGLPTDETIPLGRYGTSHAGRAKSIYRMGLGHRYGRRMQTISGLHYNWSLPGAGNEDYFALIRNFRRHAFVLLYLFGASPVVSECFVQGRKHQLQRLGTATDGLCGGCDAHTLYLPHATSLRMGRLGYQSDAQSSISVSYNGLQGYAHSLHDALTRPWPAYAQLGIRNPGGDYNQLGDSLLQIENEFYGTIRPKRSTRSGERPLRALRERGVEYVEVRLMDIDPFAPVGITAQTIQLLDTFLLHCLCTPSPEDTPEEIARIRHNQHLCAERGREKDLQLLHADGSVSLRDWAADILHQCQPIAQALDAAYDGRHGAPSVSYTQALDYAQSLVADPALTPSAKVLHATTALHGGQFRQFGLAQSAQAHAYLLDLPWNAQEQARFEAMRIQSVQAQRDMESSDTGSFEQWRQHYMSAAQLG